MSYRNFILEALKITLVSALMTLVYWYFGFSKNALLVSFTAAVMIYASTFAPIKKPVSKIFLGGVLIVCTISIAGVIGFYYPTTAKALTVILAGLAFFLARSQSQTQMYVNSVVMFLVFSALPFDIHQATQYLLLGIGTITAVVLVHWLTEPLIYGCGDIALSKPVEARYTATVIALISMAIAWLAEHLLHVYTDMSHLYWVGLTAIVVISGSESDTIKLSLKRILINAVGAVLIVVLYVYVIPANFWFNFALLGVFLFLIFALGFSYTFRVLCIELFVLGFTHVFSHGSTFLAIDRVLLTLIGGATVIIVTMLIRPIHVRYLKS